MSVRNYAILWPTRKTVVATAGGGNELLSTGQHALDGAEHTGQLPIERLSTTETDTTLVLRPDGLGGVEAAAESASGSDVFAREYQVQQTGRYLDRDGQWRDPLLLGNQTLTVATSAAAVVGDTKYHAWPDVKRLHDGRYLVVWTRGDSHNADNTGVAMAMIGVENIDGTFTWDGSGDSVAPWVVYDHASQWVSSVGVTVLSTGRVVISLFIHSSGSDPVDGAFVIYSDDVEAAGSASTWTAPITVNSSLSSYSYGSGRVVELPLGGTLGGPGRLVQFVEGKNTGDTHSRIVGLYSDDGGDSWGSQFAVAGDGTTRNYYEACGGMLSDGREMVLLRTSDGDGDIYVTFASAPYTTFSAPALAFAGHGQPNWIESSTRSIIATSRKNEGVGIGDTVLYATTATRLGVSVADWTAAVTFDSTMYEMEYAAACETSLPGRYLVVEGYQPTSSTTNSDIYAGVVTEGTTTLGASASPTGAAGGDLSGTYPNPSVVDDSHNHTAATLPTTTSSGGSDHLHVVSERHSSDGSSTSFALDLTFIADTVAAYNATTGSRLRVTETLPSTVAISAAGTAGDLIDFDYCAEVV